MSKPAIRKAVLKDTNQIVILLGELGYLNPPKSIRTKLEKLSKSKQDTILVAESGDAVVGMGHLHVADFFHQKGRLGRVMALVVGNKHQRRGIGEILMAALESRAKKAGCVKMEVTSGIQRNGAHKFYGRLGYIEKPRRFIKKLGEDLTDYKRR